MDETWLHHFHTRVQIDSKSSGLQRDKPTPKRGNDTKVGWQVSVELEYTLVCKKIKDEVENLAYQLNEEAERTERPIKRLSKVMYGSKCADMQVDAMGECLSSIKHVVGTTSGCFLPDVESIGKLEEGRSVTSVAAEFGIAHSIVSRLWRQFQTTGTAIRGFSSGRPRGTTPADDRYIVLQARRNRRQTAGEIARHTTQCVPLTPAHRRRRSLWCHGTPELRDNEWGRVLFTDESRFSLSSDSHRILIWREREAAIIPRTSLKGTGMEVAVFSFGEASCLVVVQTFHVFDAGSVNGTRYCNEILLPYVRLFRGAMGLQFLFMDDNAPCPSHSSCRTALKERLAARTLTTSNDSGASIGAARRMGSNALNNSLTPSFSAWADAVKPA
ncbi:transposable element Tcb1 transposase [Trichonephila clavipes]|nr:transposable element Tcb1 transposase [Trichonephila clavipes]